MTLDDIRARLAALPDEPTFVKGNYHYDMIRGVYTGFAVADVHNKPYSDFYQNAPTDVALLLAEVDRLTAENASMRHDLETTSGLYAVDHELLNEPDSFRIEHLSLTLSTFSAPQERSHDA